MVEESKVSRPEASFMSHEWTEPESSGRTRTLDAPVAAFVHLSGSRRGTTQRLSGQVLTVGTSPEAHVRLPTGPGPLPLPIHATLNARGVSYELLATAGAAVWVNGQPVDSLVLASGDVLEFGKDGPILRFRIYPAGSPAYKTFTEAFSDCLDCARNSDRKALGRAALWARGVTGEMATQTSRAFRTSVVIILILLVGSTALLVSRNEALEARLTEELARVEGIAELAAANDRASLNAGELAELRASVATSISDATRRLETLEARTRATGRVVEEAMASTLFLQGAYAFAEEETGRMLRLQLDAAGEPIRSPFGEPALTLDGDGPVFEVLYTGTGFIVHAARGLLMTNRHVALPWDFDDNASGLLGRGFNGVMRRFQAYLPGEVEPLPVRLSAFDEDADLAVIQVDGLPPERSALGFAETDAAPGDEVLVVGYPLGVRALVARTDPAFLQSLSVSGDTGFWDVARRLAEGNHIAPLASRGIVGQVTGQAIVYDAETTSGGSGGPVLALDGTVVAVNSAILPEFGGSNFGVPASKARVLLARALAPPGGHP